MTLQERIKAPTPPFFRRLKKAGLAVAATGATLLSAPVVLPSVLVAVAGGLVVAGGVAAAVSQLAVDESKTDSHGPAARKR